VASDAVESGMTYITGHDRSQLLLLPEAVDDYVGSDNPVRPEVTKRPDFTHNGQS